MVVRLRQCKGHGKGARDWKATRWPDNVRRLGTRCSARSPHPFPHRRLCTSAFPFRLHRSEKRLGGFKPVELSNTVSSLARLGYVPPAAWLEAFAAAVAKQVRGVCVQIPAQTKANHATLARAGRGVSCNQ